ncbi:MAG: GntR family transcriptional regulator [Armatimonadota bacterium]|nr:GntR family transcriptional regulator [Armatimonadota bacterium]
MLLTLDQTSPMPIYAQVTEQVKWAVTSGRLKRGEQLPTVRQLAVELRVNPNTVARAYAELERMGLIATQRGRGTFVLAEPRHVPEREREAELTRLARTAVAEAAALGYSPAEVARAMLKLTEQEDNVDA